MRCGKHCWPFIKIIIDIIFIIFATKNNDNYGYTKQIVHMINSGKQMLSLVPSHRLCPFYIKEEPVEYVILQTNSQCKFKQHGKIE